MDYVGENQLMFEGTLIPGPYAVFLHSPIDPEKTLDNVDPDHVKVRLLHGTITTAFFAVRQAKADQINWGLQSTKVIMSETCQQILDIEIGYFTHLNNLKKSKFPNNDN